MARIKNIYYKEFIENGLIRTLSQEELKETLKNIKGKHSKEGRVLLILLYFTGARPNEVLRLKAQDITRERNYIIVQTPASKHGLPRPIRINYKYDIIKEVYKYSTSLFGEMYLFKHYQSKYIRTTKNHKGEIKQYWEISAKLRYYFNKWFLEDMTPYFLRHNRFSRMSEKGASAEQIRLVKGAKTYGSVTPYIHLSSKESKKISKFLD